MRRTPMPPRAKLMARGVTPRRSASSPQRKPRAHAADDGVVWLRDGGFCVGCGEPCGPGRWWSIQHRWCRGQGGGDRLSNRILLCGSATSRGCHRKAEDRKLITRIRGYWIRANAKPAPDPATIPVWYARDRAWFLLDDQGGRTPCDPPEIDPADRDALLTTYLREALEDGTFHVVGGGA